jgi:hypothetical protein
MWRRSTGPTVSFSPFFFNFFPSSSGLGDLKARVSFTKVESLSEFEMEQNSHLLVRNIFAGGNHSWVLQKYEEERYHTARD